MLLKLILQSQELATSEVVNVAVPRVSKLAIVIQTSQTLISDGTKWMLVEQGEARWLEKACQQPDNVKMVLEKFRTGGFQPTLNAIFNKLNQFLGLGHCNLKGAVAISTCRVGGPYLLADTLSMQILRNQAFDSR